MQYHISTSNPIFQIYEEHLMGNISIVEALQKILSSKSLEKIQPEHIGSALYCVQHYPRDVADSQVKTLILSAFTKRCARKKKIDGKLLACINYYHGISLLGIINRQDLSYEFIETLEAYDPKTGGIDFAFTLPSLLDQILSHLTNALDYFKRNNMTDVVVECHFNYSSALQAFGFYSAALEILETVKSNTKFSNDSVQEKYNESILMIKAKLALQQNAFHLFHQGWKIIQDNQSSQYNDAIKLFQSALYIFTKIDDRTGISECLITIGDLFEHLGNFEEAIRFYEKAICIYDRMCNKEQFAKCNSNLGEIYYKLGINYKALKCWGDSITTFKTMSGMEDAIALCEANRATIYLEYGDCEMAIRLYSLALDLYRSRVIHPYSPEYTIHAASCKIGLCNAYLELNKIENAAEQCESAKNDFLNVRDTKGILKCEFLMAEIHMRKYEFDIAREKFQKLLNYLEKKQPVDSGLIYNCEMNIAIIYVQLRLYGQAINLLRKISEGLSTVSDLKRKSLCLLAEVYQMNGQIDLAQETYIKAACEIEKYWGNIKHDGLRIRYMGKVFQTYYKIVDYFLTQNDINNALQFVERLKFRFVYDHIVYRNNSPKAAPGIDKEKYSKIKFEIRKSLIEHSEEKNFEKKYELTKKISSLGKQYDEMIEKFQKMDINFDADTRSNISYSGICELVEDNNKALIELFPMKEKTAVFIITRKHKLEHSCIEVPYGLYDIGEHILLLLDKYGEYLKAYQKGNMSEIKLAQQEWEEHLDTILRDLYEKLFLRIKQLLNGIHKLIVIPFGLFHSIPFHAMYCIQNGKRKYVIDDYTVIYAPSAKLLKLNNKRDSEKKKNVLISFANPEDDSERLSYSRAETEDIHNIFKTTSGFNAKYLPTATREELIYHSQSKYIFHYAGHAGSDALILHDAEQKRKKREFRTFDISFNLDLAKTWLVTLSACDTGTTIPGFSDEYIGLPSAFLCAGAETVISSLWAVNDSSTSLLMRKMYQFILEGTGKAEALRKAQLWLKNPENTHEHLRLLGISKVGEELPDLGYSRPYHWAPFVCSGAE